MVCVTASAGVIQNIAGQQFLSPGYFSAESRKMEKVLLQSWNRYEELEFTKEVREANRKATKAERERKAKAALDAKTHAEEERHATFSQRGVRKVRVAITGDDHREVDGLNSDVRLLLQLHGLSMREARSYD